MTQDVRATTAMAAAEAARLAHAELRVAGGAAAPPIRGASIDTRTIRAGDLFAPLPGAHVDGHTFLDAAFARGAAAALCTRAHAATLAGREPGPLLVVEDVTAALQAIAAGWRKGWTGTLVAVTGSAGKTTTKNLLAATLETRGAAHRTEGNLNNHWGVPLTLMGLQPAHVSAVVELGMSHPGEIAPLAALAVPALGVITNVGNAHLEHFGTIAAIAREKASLAAALPADGVVVAHADSPELLRALAPHGRRVVTFGFAADAHVRPQHVAELGERGSEIEVAGFPRFRLPLVGRHQIANALAALAVARELRLDPAAVTAALARATPGKGRMELRAVRGATVLVDFYNANPESTRAALETLASWPAVTRRIAVLGDMLELGADAEALHRATAAAVRGAELWATGRYAAAWEDGARAAGVQVRTFADKPALASALAPELRAGVVVLLKGSRGAALEDVLHALEAGTGEG